MKVNGIREAGESKRSTAEHCGVHESTLRKRQGTGTVPTSLCRFKDIIANEEEKESAEYYRDFDTSLCGQTIRMLTALAFEYAGRKRTRVLNVEDKNNVK